MSKYYKGIKICCENCVKATFNRSTGEFVGCSWRKDSAKAECYIDSFEPTTAAYCARIDELTAFVLKVAKAYLYEWDDNLVEYLPSNFRNEACALLRGESEDGK